MPSYRVHLVTRWIASAGRNQMQAAVDHPVAGVAWTDITGQPDANILPTPNALVVEAYPVDDALLAVLQADPNAQELWSEADAS
jgi:hypothetical protein